MAGLNQTHDPNRRSWVASANHSDTDFPIQNLPLGCFSRVGEPTRVGVAIGDMIFDLRAAHLAGLLADEVAQAVSAPDVGPLLGLGKAAGSKLRAVLSDLLAVGGDASVRAESQREQLLVPVAGATLHLPTRVNQFTDMCVSTFHIGRRAGNDERGQPIVPSMFRWQPVGYDGRSTAIRASGSPVRRPNGTFLARPEDSSPTFGPEPRLDFELEVGAWVCGTGLSADQPVLVADARDHVFGYCLLNDWSARGVQLWESFLGPFLGKSFATTISPWIVTDDALEPFRTNAFVRPAGDPPILPHLFDDEDQRSGGFDIVLDAHVCSATMRKTGTSPDILVRTNFRHMYFTWAQMIAHHTSNGCRLSAGDLVGSGTCSGPGDSEAACLAEKVLGGAWALPSGESRLFLEDGDEVILSGRAMREGFVPIGFGEARAIIEPALNWDNGKRCFFPPVASWLTLPAMGLRPSRLKA